MTNENHYEPMPSRAERDFVAENLADVLFSLQGSYPSALARLCTTIVDRTTVYFARAMTQDFLDELDSANQSARIGVGIVAGPKMAPPVACETSPIPRHTRIGAANEAYELYTETGNPPKILPQIAHGANGATGGH